MNNKSKVLLIYILSLSLSLPAYAYAGPSSKNYELKSYSFGAGSTDNNTGSTNFKVNGMVGEVDMGRLYSQNFKFGGGLSYMLNANVPPAPTLTNPGGTYDRLKVVVNEGPNKSDTTYAIGISTDNFNSDKRYIKADDTVGDTLTAADFKLYKDEEKPNWASASGFFVTGLQPGTNYYVRAKARAGNFTESEWGPSSPAVSTSTSSITLNLDSNSITFNQINASNAYTDDTQQTVMTITTNAYNGYTVYGKENQPLTSAGGSTINDYASCNDNPTVWSDTGFGYNTSDTDLSGNGGTTRFANDKYAGFKTTAPCNAPANSPGFPVADNAGPVQEKQISDETTIKYRVTADATTTAGVYKNVILYTIVPTF